MLFLLVEMWKEALFSATALLYAENWAMWNKNLIFGGAISWNQAITLCSGKAVTHNMPGMLGVLEWVSVDSCISSVSPYTDSTSHTQCWEIHSSQWQWCCCFKNEWSLNVEVSGAMFERLMMRCLWYLLFPHCRGDVLLWEHRCVTWPGAALCTYVCVFTH